MIGWNARARVPTRGEGPSRGGRLNGLIVAFVVLSACVSMLILGCRNLFDDEIFSLPFVTGPVSGILAMAREGDVHPPGMYLLAHLAWRMVPSYRWLNLVPMTVLYAGLAWFLLNFLPRFRSRSAALIALGLATLHPGLLMWGNTFRWYCPWTGLALVALVLFVEPRREEWGLAWGEGLAGGLLLAAMFYLNYITVLFVLALAPAVWVRMRGGAEAGGLRKVLLAVGVFLALVMPQVHTLVAVHLGNSGAQRSGILLSTVRLGQALAGSEAYLPWHPLAIAAGLALVLLWAAGMGVVLRRSRVGVNQDEVALDGAGQRALLVFGIGFFLLVALSGLGGKPRNAIVLVPVFAPAVGFGAAKLRGKYGCAVLALLVTWWVVGAVHLTRRFGLQKANMNDRPEQVVSLIARGQARGPDPGCGLAITYDSGVAFRLAQARVPRLMILSPFRGMLFAGTLEDLPEACAQPRLYVVESYRSGEPDRDWKYTAELKAAEGYVQGGHGVVRLSRDPDAAMKRKLGRFAGLEAGASLPDYRFAVLSGQMERAQLPELRRTLHYFVSWEDIVPDSSGEDEPGTD